jgi:hypothetical protein
MFVSMANASTLMFTMLVMTTIFALLIFAQTRDVPTLKRFALQLISPRLDTVTPQLVLVPLSQFLVIAMMLVLLQP